MRCPDCNKFVSLDEPEVEVNDVEIDEKVVRAEVTINLNCAECGTTLKAATLDAENDLGVDVANEATFAAHEGEECDLTVEEGDAEPTDKTDGKGRRATRIIGASLDVDVSCACGGLEGLSTTLVFEEEYSAFEEQV